MDHTLEHCSCLLVMHKDICFKLLLGEYLRQICTIYEKGGTFLVLWLALVRPQLKTRAPFDQNEN